MVNTVYFQMTFGLLLYLKLARVVVGNVSKNGKNMEGIFVLSIFASWFFNQTLSIYLSGRGRTQICKLGQRLL